MKTILIDPETRTVTAIEIAGGLESYYETIGCDLIDFARADDVDVIVDDEGLFKENKHFFGIHGYPKPLAGKALLVGVNDEGDTIDCPIALEEAVRRIVFLRAVAAIGNRVIWEQKPAQHGQARA